MNNCRQLAHESTIVILDDTCFFDTMPTAPWTHGPTRVWREFLCENKIVELGRRQYTPDRGMVWGKYI